MPHKPGDPRGTAKYRRLRAEFLKHADPVCYWCGVAVSDALPMGSARKSTLDHLVEVDLDPRLAYEVALFRVACWGCNSSRGSRYAAAQRATAARGTDRRPSRAW